MKFMIRGMQITLLVVTVCAATLRAQDNPTQLPTAPPPLKIISGPERAQITDTKDAKARVRTTIELADAHLANAEAQTSQNNYDGAAAEVGKYWALVEDVFIFLKAIKSDNNKTRDLYKRVELSLRAQGPRLIAIRRRTPAEYAVWIREIEEFARKGRTEALNSFYGNTVVRDQLDQKQVSKPTQKTSIMP
jgi:hypothetical protein